VDHHLLRGMMSRATVKWLGLLLLATVLFYWKTLHEAGVS
jgi:hypothetical protein